MMSVFHLAWICPIVFTLGFGIATLLAVHKDVDEWERHNKE